MDRMTRVVGLCFALAALGASPAAAGPSAPPVTIGIQKAQMVALAHAPGQPLDTRLVSDEGRIAYDVEVHSVANTIKDVEVDAFSGKVLKVQDHSYGGGLSREVEAP
jgi:hypothetical protein